MLLGVGLLRVRRPFLPQDGPVRRPLEALPEEEGMERHLVRRDPHDAELAEERLAFLAELLHECVVRRLAAERLARVAVEVRHHEVDPVLVEGVERHAFLEDAP